MNKYKMKRYLILSIIFILTVSTSTGISMYQNHLYYSELERNYKNEQIKYLDTVSYYFSDCIFNNISKQICKNNLTHFIDRTALPGITTLTFEEQTYSIDKEKIKDSRSPVTTSKIISENPFIEISITKLTKQPISISFLNSLTFSYTDPYSEWRKLDTTSFINFFNHFSSREFQKFIWNVVIPRSAFLWLTLISFLVFYFIIKKIFDSIMTELIENEYSLREVVDESTILNDRISNLLNNKENLEAEIKIIKNNESNFNKKIKLLSEKIELLESEKKKLDSDRIRIEKAEKNILEKLKNQKEEEDRIKNLLSTEHAKEEKNTKLISELKEELINSKKLENLFKEEHTKLKHKLVENLDKIGKLQEKLEISESSREDQKGVIELYQNEVIELENKLKNDAEKLKEANEKIKDNQKEISLLKNSISEVSIYRNNFEKVEFNEFKKVAKLLLENPEIKKKKAKHVKFNKGKHHSKDIIEQVKNKLINSQLSNWGIVESVNPCHYNPAKRGQIILQKPVEKKYTEERYILQIFHTGDAGYGIEILLTAKNIWEAVLQAKLIREIHEFNQYDLEIKI